MIAADTSALLAIQFNEPECNLFVERIKTAGTVLVSAVSVVEARMVVYGRAGHSGVVALNRMLETPFFEIVSPGTEEIDAAYDAFVSFGRGSGHRAGLNFGDIFAYALAKTRNLPLLFKGNDFAHTDVHSAINSTARSA